MSDPHPGADRATADDAGTRERILRSAYGLFSRQGFARVSMRQVAIDAGVTKPALYYYFRNKESLFEQCLADFNEVLAATMERAVRQRGTGAERVRAVAEALLSGWPYHPVRVHEELLEDVSGPLRELLRRTFSSVVMGPVVDLFIELRAGGELRTGVLPADAASLLVGACMAFLPRAGAGADDEAWAPLPAVAATRLGTTAAAALVADLVLSGIGA